MKKILLLISLMGVLVHSQINPKGEFCFSGEKFYIREISTLEYNPEIQISVVAFKVLKDKKSYYYFVLDERHKVIRFYIYTEDKWYDVKSENIFIELKYYY